MKKYKIAITYDVVTYESAENGDTAENGFIIEEEYWTAQEIADYVKRRYSDVYDSMQGYTFYSYPDTDYRTGDSETEYFHINSPMDTRIFNAICKYAGY